MLSYFFDEVGNYLISIDEFDDKGINFWLDVLIEEKYRELFGYNKYIFIGVDYVDYYKNLIKDCGVEVEIVFVNNLKIIFNYIISILICDIYIR